MTYTFIVLIIYVAAHIIAAMAKKAAERKERERIRVEMERRRGQSGPAQPTSQQAQVAGDPGWGQPGGPANPLPSPVRTGRPVDDLVARRQQQLEQLRLRREAGRQGARSAPTRSDTPPVQRTEAPRRQNLEPGLEAEQQRRLREQAEARRVREANEARRREDEKHRREKKAGRAQERPEQSKRAAPSPDPRVVAKSDRTSPVGQTRPTAPTVRTASSQNVGVLRSRLHDPNTIRDLFILKEMIDPPVALRTGHFG